MYIEQSCEVPFKINSVWFYKIFVVAVAYVLTGWLGLSVPFAEDKVTLFWLPTGIAVAALYRCQTRVWPGIFLGAFIVNALTGASFFVNFIIACGNTLGPLFTVFLLRRFHCHPEKFQRSTALTFIVITSMGMLIPASIGGTAVMFSANIDILKAFTKLYLPWWMGDSLGVLLAAPLFINITKNNITKLLKQKKEAFWIFACATIVAMLCFPLNSFGSGIHLPILFLSCIFVVWASLSLGLLGGALSVIGFSFIAIWSTVNHVGPLVFPDIHISYWLLWLYTTSLSCMSLLITVTYAELSTTSSRLMDSYNEQQLQKMHIEKAQLMARVVNWSWHKKSDTYHFSSSMTNLFQLPSHLLQGRLKDFTSTYVSPEDQSTFMASLNAIETENKPLSMELQIEMSGQIFWLDVQAGAVENNLSGNIQGTFQDITERKRFDIALSTAAAVSAESPDFYVVLLKALRQAVGVEHALISMIDPENKDQVTVHTYLRNEEHQPNFCYALKDTPCATVINNNVCFISADAYKFFPNDEMLVAMKIQSYLGAAINDSLGNTIGILIVLGEKPLCISSQIQSLMLIFAGRISGELRRTTDQDQIYNLAFFDPLTQLPNRRMLLARLELMTDHSARTGQYGALLFIDLDHFKLLNDSRGHHTGDLLLIQVANRINSIIRKTDVVARLGGDEFVIVLDALGSSPEDAAFEAKKRAESLHSLLNSPYSLHNSDFHCTASIGVKLFNDQHVSINDLLRHADVAMYQAKDSGRNAIRFFDPSMQLIIDTRASMESDLRIAQNSDLQLIPYYQAQINLQGKAVGAELLLRWQHTTKGIISPAEFIPVAEQSGLIIGIGKQVIRQACEQLNRWKDDPHFSHLSIAVNVSPIQFNQPNFIEDVLEIVTQSGINQRLLKLELTEGSLFNNVDASIDKMQILQDFGIGFSMDDFGTGYSSLSYLKRLPIYQLKIDQSFVRDIAVDPNDAIIVQTIISMAKNLNLNVIAEGVETEEQKNFLELNGCSMFQGYYFGRPVPIAEFEAQVLQHNY